MADTEPTKDEVMAVYPTVAATIADALGCDVEEVTLEVSLVEDLDAESIDFLDLVFPARARVQAEDSTRQDRRGSAR